ncbi:hypothetical protein ACFL6T_05160 [Candidatus Zixiibacteriota bacterium]
MNILKSIRLIMGVNTLLVASLAVLSTWLCRRYGWTADFPLTIIGIAVVFPIVFSISGAYKRRETALKHYGTMKAFGRALFLASRDWVDDDYAPHQEQLRSHLQDLFHSCRELFHATPEDRDMKENQIYTRFSELSLFIKGFRTRGMSTGEVSRANQYLSKIIEAFESLKHIFQYRTPRTLRAYSKLFIFLLPVLYGPYFAKISIDTPFILAFIMPVLFSVVLVSLDYIQDHLENPFDQIGEDDIKINAEKFADRLSM